MRDDETDDSWCHEFVLDHEEPRSIGIADRKSAEAAKDRAG